MKTPTRDSSQHPPLPPAPAPTARDANPWTISSQPKAPAAPVAAPRPEWLRPKSPKVPPEARRPDRGTRPGSVLPIVVLLFVFALALAGVAQSLSKGDLEGAIGPLMVGGFAALVALRRARKRRS